MKNLDPIDIVAVIDQATKEEKAGSGQEVIAEIYADWLKEYGAYPATAPVWFNYGCSLSRSGAKELSEQAFSTALERKPDFWQACVNLGLGYEARSEFDLAKSLYRKYLLFQGDDESQTQVRNHLGRLLESERDFSGAIEQYALSLRVNPTQQDVFQHWFHLRQKQCDWPLESLEKPITISDLAKNIGPIAAMAYFDDPSLLRIACDAWIDNFRKDRSFDRLANLPSYEHSRIRIGYVSCDFRAHAVCFLNALMFEAHDREKFEVFGFDFSKNEDTVWRKLVLKGMDHVYAIHDLDDLKVAQLIRSLEIDVLVDLVGLTSGARPDIFCYRPAPLQLSYLGFLGPTGDREIDYLVCDRYVIPPDTASLYGVKPLYVNFYQVNNRLRFPEKGITRSSVGLPEGAFVYCALNNSYKITEVMLHRWVGILSKCPDSVLWLLEDSEAVAFNIKKYLRRYDIDQNRVIFTGRVTPNEYLARFALADLFLDSSPYNAGATAADALWVGLPVLTCPGNTFVSRMAAAMLSQLGLEEFICSSWSEYEDKAVSFYWAKNAKRILEERNIQSHRIFDTATFVRDFESELLKILRRAPDNAEAS
jgi:predicted O-linked N-acetylglucosamine transferase (SPINDLY family)